MYVVFTQINLNPSIATMQVGQYYRIIHPPPTLWRKLIVPLVNFQIGLACFQLYNGCVRLFDNMKLWLS